MNIHDQLFVLVFLFLSGGIVAGARALKLKFYSKFLLLIICTCLIVMGVFHTFFLIDEAPKAIHFTVLTLAQFGVLGLAFHFFVRRGS